MSYPRDELPDILSQHTLGQPYDPSSRSPERFVIDFLEEQVEDWEQGSISTANLLATFNQHNTGSFDIRSWLQSKVDEGVYVWPEDDAET